MADQNDLTEGKLQKMEVDYSSTVDEKVPQCEAMAKSGKLEEAIETLMALEKQTRTGADAISTGRILVAIVRICHDAKKYDLLNENIVQLTKKRGQLKQAVTKMVQEAFSYVDKMQPMETKLKLIETLRTVTAGKIYVEIERARLSRILSKIREDEGNVTEAAAVLQELQVETFGSMEKREKVEFILEQMRLCLAKKDYVRTQIISKKVTTKYFDEKDSHDLKLKYYQLMIELDQHDSSYLSICKHYLAIYNTPVIKEDIPKRNEALICAILYLVLAPYNNEQNDLIHRLQADVVLEDLKTYRDLLKLFTNTEVMRWKDLCTHYEKDLRTVVPGCAIFAPKTEEGDKRWADLKIRVVEHNIHVMSKYYTRVHVNRMAVLLDLTEAETEEFLSNLVVSKTIEAKIDRLDGTVSFQRPKEPNETLNDWSHNVNALMTLVNKATHLITKEQMVHKMVA
jgi:26S proteasome regulatory subunit N5